MEIKYTTDGKKVAVLGKINAQESIVQEVFFIGDQEIPSGENFVVKSLHDAPAISWKEKKLKELEDTYKSEEYRLSNELKSLQTKYYDICKVLKEKIGWAAEAIKNISSENFNRLSDLLTGEIRFVVIKGYSDMTIQPFDHALKNYTDYSYGERRVEAIKMITLYGNKERGLEYKLNRWSDGSGSDTEIELFRTEVEAIEYVSNWVNDGQLTSYKIKAAKNYSITIKSELLTEYKEKEIQAHEATISKQKATLSEQIQKLENVKNGDIYLPLK